MEHINLCSAIHFTVIYTWTISTEIFFLIPMSFLHIHTYLKYSLCVSLGLLKSFPTGACEDDWP